MINYKQVVKRYSEGTDEITAVDNLSLEVPAGELVVLLGPSGCGKTTLLRLTNRLEELSAGQIIINGTDITQQDEVELRQRIGYVIQEIGLFPNKTIGENVGMVPKIIGWEAARIETRVNQLLRMMNLEPEVYKNRYPAQLSGGQRQRVGVARALGADPEILLMDEPFGAIDPINRQQIQNEFLKLQEKLGKTIVFVSHDIQEAIKMGDRIALMKQGQLIQYATPEEILMQPADDFVRDFVGTERAMKALSLIRVKEAMGDVAYKYEDLAINEALKWLTKHRQDYLLICAPQKEPLGYVSREELESAVRTGAEKIKPYIRDLYTVLYYEDTLQEALTAMVSNEVTTLYVVDEDDKLVGTIDFDDIQAYLQANYQVAKESTQ